MQMVGMCSTSICNSTFLFTALHYGIVGSGSRGNNQKSNAAFSPSFPPLLLSSPFQPSHFPSLSTQLRPFAFKKGRKDRNDTTLVEMQDSDDDDDDDEFLGFDDEFDGGDDDDDGEDDERMFVPFGEMKRWLEKKPRGFGQGKVYDTSIEDKLLDEIEQSRQAQIVNVNNLKNNPINNNNNSSSKQTKKVAEEVASGIRVRVANLPKKKNIQRDLKAAFNGVSGIINISPAVSGNKKTKDPVCKGFAFVHFKREEDAARFVQSFSGQSLTFGRVQKRIKCEMIDSRSRDPALVEMGVSDSVRPEVAISASVDSENADFDMRNSSSDCSVEIVSDEFDEREDDIHNSSSDFSVESVSDEFDEQDDDMHDSDFSIEILSDEFDDEDDDVDAVELGEGRDSIDVTSDLEAGSSGDMEYAFKGAADSSSSDRLARIRALEQKLLARGKTESPPKEQKGQKLERSRSIEKKPVTKRNQKKAPKEQKPQKLDIPGSAKRLKIKEKALLTGVFSKYGLKTASREESQSANL